MSSSRSSSWTGEQDPGARSSQLDGERQVVEATADGGHGLHRLRPDRTLAKQGHGVGLEQRLDWVLALSCNPKRGSTRHEQVEIGARRNQLGEGRRTRRAAARSCRAGAASASRRHARRESRGRRSPGRSRSRGDPDRSPVPAMPRRRRPGNLRQGLQQSPARVASCRFLPARSSVTTRCPRASGTSSATSRTRPINGLAWLGRFVAFNERSGGKASLPSWYRRSGSGMSLSR